MPRKTEWIHRIPQALAALERSPAPLLDRADLERLLAVSRRQALRILDRLGATAVGRNLFVGRTELIERLRALHAGEDAQYERRRLQRLDRTLAGLARDLKSARIPVAATPEAHSLLFPALPPSVRIRPGRLEIDFENPQELLTRLFELSQAIANDYDRFEAVCSPGAAGMPEQSQPAGAHQELLPGPAKPSRAIT